ncbi:MAG: hypothetical protein IIX65_03995 [Lachnospiraceae bacterium]|nr:hypothetical protein [Lachnospiraceae bacterium]
MGSSSHISMCDIDVNKLIEVIDTCKSDVFLITDDGDRLNLKSKLCQMVGLTRLMENATFTKATVFCTDPEDDAKIFRFALYGEMPEK